MADVWLQDPFCPNLPQTGIAFVDHLNYITMIGAPDETIDGKALHQWIVGRYLRDIAACKPNNYDSTLEVNAT